MHKAKVPLSVNALKAVVAKFEKTGSLKVQLGRGRKSVTQDALEEIATEIVDRAEDNRLHFQCSWGISEHGQCHTSTVWKILWKVIHFYPYKINLSVNLNRYTDRQK